MKKKLLSILLALTLLLGLLPAATFHAHAEGGNEASVTIGDVTTEYATLEAALEQVYKKTATIDLLTDVTVEGTISLSSYENLLLRGNGHTITLNSDSNVIHLDDANLTLDGVCIHKSAGSGRDAVRIKSGNTLTLQNGASVYSAESTAIVNNGTLTIADGTVITDSSNKYAINSENATVNLEALGENSRIHIMSNRDNAVLVQSGSATIAGNLDVKGIRVSRYGPEGAPASIKLSGALTGEPISVHYEHFSQSSASDLAMIAPAEGYTITAADAEKIKPQDIDFSSYLGEDGWIWAKYAHVHRPLNENDYSQEDDGTHSFYCVCAQTVTENCVYEINFDHEKHWNECSLCGYIDQETMSQHTDTNNDCVCEVCGDANHQADQWTADPDLVTHTGVCTACGKDLREEHALIWGMDDESHWWYCAKNCGYREESESHGWSEWICKDGQNIHYKQCSCGMVLEEPHTDNDKNLICEICGGEPCYDKDGNHKCDKCGLFLKELCVDTDNNHRCDEKLCNARLAEWCVDTDNNHRCDNPACRTYLSELCTDADNDWLCDVCRIDLCDHWGSDFICNEDNTHTFTCEQCGRPITRNCEFTDGQMWDDSAHWDICICGRCGDEVPHTFSQVTNRTPVGHVLKCAHCPNTRTEAHQFVDGSCKVCETGQTENYDVYVGGVGLESGDYLDLDGNRTTTMPDSGYAYYKDGVLTLHNYHCDGDGFRWKEEYDGEEDAYIPYTAVLYATTDLILELSGENSLSNMADTGEMQRDAIASERDLTICGQGSLTVLADNDGIHLQNGDLTIKEGDLYLGILDEENIEIGDEGIDADDGDVIIEGSKLFINSNDCGMDVNGDVIIRGGFVDVTAGDDGIEAEENIIILDGDVSIEAMDYGLDCNEESVIIAGGYVDIYVDNRSGILSDGSVEIYGGTIEIDAWEAGIDAYEHVTIFGGCMEIYSNWYNVYAREITLHVELPEDAYLEDDGGDMCIDSDNGLVIDGSTEEDARIPAAFCKDGKLLLGNIPNGLTVTVIGYTNGQMTELQLVENVTGDIELREDVLACEEIKALFLGGGYVPLRTGLPIE